MILVTKTLVIKVNGGWAAIIQQYFVGAWIPREDASK